MLHFIIILTIIHSAFQNQPINPLTCRGSGDRCQAADWPNCCPQGEYCVVDGPNTGKCCTLGPQEPAAQPYQVGSGYGYANQQASGYPQNQMFAAPQQQQQPPSNVYSGASQPNYGIQQTQQANLQPTPAWGLGGQGSVPSGQGSVASGYGTVPGGQGNMRSGQGNVPSGQGNVPSGQINVPSGYASRAPPYQNIPQQGYGTRQNCGSNCQNCGSNCQNCGSNCQNMGAAGQNFGGAGFNQQQQAPVASDIKVKMSRNRQQSESHKIQYAQANGPVPQFPPWSSGWQGSRRNKM